MRGGYSSDRDVDVKSESAAEDEGEGQQSPRSRSPKRRRISISSTFSIDAHSPQHSVKLESESEDEDAANGVSSDTAMLDAPIPSSPSPSPKSEDQDSSPSISPLHARALKNLASGSTSVSIQQPTFQKAPRFKPTEAPDGARFRADPPPDAFSPRRRGAKYVPGGLAASVRDWFVDVWAGAGGGAGGAAGAEWAARVTVCEVRAAAGMVLVVGRYVRAQAQDVGEREGKGVVESEGFDTVGGEGGDGVDEVDVSPGNARIVLAGSPRVAGLERRPEVRPGAVVGVGRPTWEVEIPGQGRWAVACEWAVLR